MDEWLGFDYQGTAGERCDIALTLELRRLPEFADLSRARVQALIDAGGVVYDGKEVPRGQKNLRPGMHLELNLSQLRRLLHPAAPEDVEPLDLPLEFLHIDSQLAVVCKPAGLSVHPAATETGPTLTAALLHHLGQLSDFGGNDRPGIVHRLDKETSGVLVVARNNQTHAALSAQFERREVEKEYLALCIDAPQPAAGNISAPIERHPFDRQKMWARGGGRPALTEYRIADNWGALTLLEVAIHTGRTHQIRVHLLQVGSCILNDMKYGEGRNHALRKFLKGSDPHPRSSWREAWPSADQRSALLNLLKAYTGIFLHSRRLIFTDPATKQRLSFTAPVPRSWEELQQLSAESSS